MLRKIHQLFFAGFRILKLSQIISNVILLPIVILQQISKTLILTILLLQKGFDSNVRTIYRREREIRYVTRDIISWQQLKSKIMNFQELIHSVSHYFAEYSSKIHHSNTYLQKYTTRRSFLQYLNSDFLFYLGWSGSLSTKQANYNEGCSKLNYLLAEV